LLIAVLALTLAEASDDWSQVAIEVSGVDGHRADWLASTRRLGSLCATEPLACDWARSLQGVETAPLDVAQGLSDVPCADGHPVACLVRAWSLGRGEDRAWRAPAEVDGTSIREALTTACDAGLPRACVELGWTQHLGIGTYVQEEEAASRWTALCDAGESAACRALAEVDEDDVDHLRKALELGDPAAPVVAVGRLPDDEVLAPLAASCEQGVAAACVQAGRLHDGDERGTFLERGCQTTDAEACARFAVYRGESPAGELRELGRRWPLAGTWAGLVDAGAPIDPFTEPYDLHQVDEKVVRKEVERLLWPCYARLLQEGEAGGWVDVSLLTDADGDVVRGAVSGDGLDEAFHECADSALQDVRAIEADGRPRLAHVRASLAHTARVKALAVVDDVVSLTRVSDSAQSWADDLGACGVGKGPLRLDTEGVYRVKVKRSGELLPAKTVVSSEYDAVDACVVEALAGRTTEPLIIPTKVDLEVRVLDQKELPEPEPVFREEPMDFQGEPEPHRVLLLFVEELRVGKEKARLTDTSESSVQAAFEEAARFVEKATGGALDVVVESRRIDGVDSRGIGARERSSMAWNVHLDDLPYDVFRGLERDTWDAVFLWAPIPRGAPRPYGYMYYSAAQLHGAAVASSTLAEGRELLLVDGTPASTLAVQMLYDAWDVRSHQLLGVDLPPNDRPLRLTKTRKLEPRIGLSEDRDPLDFYRHVLYNDLPVDLWRDLRAATHQAHVLDEDNLAFQAMPVGKDRVRGLHLLVDGILEAGSFSVSALDPAESDDEGERGTWFGLEWDEPVRVGRLTGRIHVDGEPELEVQRLERGHWKDVGRTVAGADGVFDFRWEGNEVEGLRIQLVVAGDVEVDELQAYAP